MGLKQGESPMKYYKNKAAKSGPLKIAPGLIAKLAPMAINAISGMGKGKGKTNNTESQGEGGGAAAKIKKVIGL